MAAERKIVEEVKDEAASREREFQTTIDDERKRLALSEARKAELCTENEQLKARNLEQRFRYDAEIQRLQTEKDKLTDRMRELERQNAILQFQLRSLTEEKEDEESEHKTALKASGNEVQVLNDQLFQSRLEKGEVESKNREHVADLAMERSANAVLQVWTDETYQAQQQAVAERDDLAKALDAEQLLVAKLKPELEAKEAECKALRFENQDLKAQVDVLTPLSNSLEKTLAEKEKEMEDLKSKAADGSRLFKSVQALLSKDMSIDLPNLDAFAAIQVVEESATLDTGITSPEDFSEPITPIFNASDIGQDSAVVSRGMLSPKLNEQPTNDYSLSLDSETSLIPTTQRAGQGESHNALYNDLIDPTTDPNKTRKQTHGEQTVEATVPRIHIPLPRPEASQSAAKTSTPLPKKLPSFKKRSSLPSPANPGDNNRRTSHSGKRKRERDDDVYDSRQPSKRQ